MPLLNAVAEKMPKFKGYLFSRDGGKTPLTKSQLSHMIERYQKRHNISATPHQLRHAFATFAVEAELNIKETQYILGHSDIHTIPRKVVFLCSVARGLANAINPSRLSIRL